MCSSKSKLQKSTSINGRTVLHPNCNRAPLLERRNSLPVINTTSSPADYNHLESKIVPSLILNRINDPPNATVATAPAKPLHNNKSKTCTGRSSSFKCASPATVDAPAGSIAAARREQVAILQEQRKMRIAHYGRTIKSSPGGKLLPPAADHNDDQCSSLNPNNLNAAQQEIKRCSFITPNSDPIYVAYHDEEWGVPVHDDKLLFELLVLTGAQVGSDWTSVLRKRQDFRDAFSRFDAEIVSKLSEKKMNWISAEYCIELSLERGVVDNSKRILEIKKEFGSFNKYLWGFVNHKPIVTQYKWCHKIPAKTSKSETISKDMVRRGFRLVGPTVIHSFMQAAGLTNDHLITCPRHSQCLP
ncbi:DNA-3-methyladenine glycosylase I [Handroanthus impetiginosus]|uniref:DNA-3-methyladenine glycosylase I n=1 Tax=Handroanthus impetiginosus TaxID=429701 RepID=A0A2G9I3T8_9LAMI|nr:DNA-3-methyladenine glycosylase I [Handroanthus impetiginosus]